MTTERNPARLATQAGYDHGRLEYLYRTDIGLQIRVLGALTSHADVRRFAKASEIPVAGLFDHEVPRELASAALDERKPRFEARQDEDVFFYEAFAHIFTPFDAAWGIDLFRLLVAARWAVVLPATLRYWADALEHGWQPIGRARVSILRALEGAAA